MTKTGRTKVAFLAATAMALTALSARATLTIGFPMTYSTPNIVGSVEGFAGDNPGSDASRFAQNLLNYSPANTQFVDTSDGNRIYHTAAVDYSGIIHGLGIKTDTPNPGTGTVYVPSGYDWAIAKYDGKNAGWVMFYLGGSDAYIPALSQTFWGNAGTDQYKISSFTVFDAVPEPTTLIAAGLLLLPFGASTVRNLRRAHTA